MREPVDPPRLFDDRSEATRVVREGLEALRKELPPPARTEALVQGVQRALVRPPSAPAVRSALSGKWLSALVLGGALGLAAYGLRSAPRAEGTRPAQVSTAAAPPAVEPAQRVAVPRPRDALHTLPGASGQSSAVPASAAPEAHTPAAAPPTERTAAQHRAADPAETGRAPAAAAPSATRGAASGGARSSAGPRVRTRARGATSGGGDDSAAARDRESGAVDELGLIRAAQVALRSSPARALSLLARHRELAPNGALAEEREVLTLDALGALARPRTSEVRAFLARYPRSLHAARVRAMLDDAR